MDKRPLLVVGLAAALLAPMLVMMQSSTASAFNKLGCRFSGSDPVIPYRFTPLVSGSRTQATQGGGSEWNKESIPGSFKNWGGGKYKILVDEGSYVADFEARIVGTCPGGRWSNDQVSMDWNTPSPGGIGGSSTALKAVATHELGHAYGLGHTTGTPCSGTPSVMRTGMAFWSCGWGNWPFPDDRAGIRAIY